MLFQWSLAVISFKCVDNHESSASVKYWIAQLNGIWNHSDRECSDTNDSYLKGYIEVI